MTDARTCPACSGHGAFGKDAAGRPWRCINCAGTGKADGFGEFERHFSERPAAGVSGPAGSKR